MDPAERPIAAGTAAASTAIADSIADSFVADSGAALGDVDSDANVEYGIREFFRHEEAGFMMPTVKELWEPLGVGWDPRAISTASLAVPASATMADVCSALTPSSLGENLASVKPLSWLRSYSRSAFYGDFVAGLTVGSLLIPQSIAYCRLAGLPPVYGLYAAIVPGAVYSLLGTIPTLSYGPFALVSLMVAKAAYAATGERGGASASERYLATVFVLSCVMGIVQMLMGVCRLGLVVLFLSPAMIQGFTTAAALLIASSQIKLMTGISVPDSSDSAVGEFFYSVSYTLLNLRQVHFPTLLFTMLALVLLFGMRWLCGLPAVARRIKFQLPYEFIVLLIGILLSNASSAAKRWGIATVGPVPSVFPSPRMPQLGSLATLPLAFDGIVLGSISFLISASIGKTYERKMGVPFRANVDLFAQGLANFVGSMFSCFPACGSLSRSAVAISTGARTQFIHCVSSLVVLAALLFAGPLFGATPLAFLGAIIVFALWRMFLQVQNVPRLWRVCRSDAVVWLGSFFCVLLFGVSAGLLMGAAGSLFAVIFSLMRPHADEMVRYHGTREYRSAAQWPTSELVPWPRIKVLNYGASLFFANAPHFRDFVLGALAQDTRFVVLDLTAVGEIDSAALEILDATWTELSERGVDVLLARPRKRVRTILRHSSVASLSRSGTEVVFFTVHDACLHAYRTLLREHMSERESALAMA